jgi:hypothetical protein
MTGAGAGVGVSIFLMIALWIFGLIFCILLIALPFYVHSINEKLKTIVRLLDEQNRNLPSRRTGGAR